MSDVELLAILIASGSKTVGCNPEESCSATTTSMSWQSSVSFKNSRIGQPKAITIMAALKLAKDARHPMLSTVKR